MSCPWCHRNIEELDAETLNKMLWKYGVFLVDAEFKAFEIGELTKPSSGRRWAILRRWWPKRQNK